MKDTRLSAPRINARGASSKKALLDVTVRHIDESGESGVRLESILKDAGVSVSSLYHHYGNLRSLVEAAQLERFHREMRADVAVVAEMVQTLTTSDELRARILQAGSGFFGPGRGEQRMQRIHAYAVAYRNPEYSREVARIQKEYVDTFATIISDLVARALVPSHVNVNVVAAWIGSLSLGRTFFDVFEDTALLAQWRQGAGPVLLSLLGL